MFNLNEAFEYGIIDPSHLQRQIEMKKKETILKDHPYKISLGSDGRWMTYIPDKEKGRILVKKTKKEDLENYLVDFYSKKELTFGDVYYEWRSYHDKMIGINTIAKHDSDRVKFFDDTRFFNIPITSIIEDDIRVFVHERTCDLKLCEAGTKRLFRYITDVLEFAIRKEYISKDPARYIRVRDFTKDCYPSVNSKKKKVIPPNECSLIREKIDHDLKVKPNYIPLYAIIFASLTGMRVGEIIPLTWDDVKDGYIEVNKSQKYNPKTKTYYISKTKNGKERRFPVTDEIETLLKTVRRVEEEYGYLSDYVFSDKKGILNTSKVRACLARKCKSIDLTPYGVHAYRRTLNSRMAYNNVPGSVRAELLGHTKSVNEDYYTFDVSTMNEKRDIVSKASLV